MPGLPLIAAHSRAQMFAIRELAPEAELLLPRHVTITGGPLFVHELIKGLDPPPWADCSNFRGHALGLLRLGIPRLIIDAPPDVFEKLSAIGAQTGTIVSAGLNHPVFYLKPGETGAKVIAARLRQAGLIV